MNHMKAVARLLGVDTDEEFEIKDLPGKFKINENGLRRFYPADEQNDWIYYDHTLTDLLIGTRSIKEKPILTDNEKEYLSRIIKPFRDNIQYIVKLADKNCFYLKIFYKTDEISFDIDLPNFEVSSKFNRMKFGKYYSLEGLDL